MSKGTKDRASSSSATKDNKSGRVGIPNALHYDNSNFDDFEGTNWAFRHKKDHLLSTTERILIDNIWVAYNTHSDTRSTMGWMLRTISALTAWITEKNRPQEAYVITKGNKPGIYASWINCSSNLGTEKDRHWKKFNNFTEAWIAINQAIPDRKFFIDEKFALDMKKIQDCPEESEKLADLGTLQKEVEDLKQELADKEEVWGIRMQEAKEAYETHIEQLQANRPSSNEATFMQTHLTNVCLGNIEKQIEELKILQQSHYTSLSIQIGQQVAKDYQVGGSSQNREDFRESDRKIPFGNLSDDSMSQFGGNY